MRSEWGEAQPRAPDENAFLESHSWAEYAAWHLGLTDGCRTTRRVAMPLSSAIFAAYRSGLIACHYRASSGNKEIELAAHELLQLLDSRRAQKAKR